jgi:hypothetical protein
MPHSASVFGLETRKMAGFFHICISFGRPAFQEYGMLHNELPFHHQVRKMGFFHKRIYYRLSFQAFYITNNASPFFPGV